MQFKTFNKHRLTDYAELFNISSILIKAANPHIKSSDVDRNVLLNIPGYQLIKHTVTNNSDTIESLSEQYKTNKVLIKLINHHIDSHTLSKGELIYIPIRVTSSILQDVDFYSYKKMVRDIDQLIAIYPFIQKNIIGYSVLNKPIIELKIGMGPYHTHINGSFHGNEWITTAAIMNCINDYALLLTELSHYNDLLILDTFQDTCISVVPMVNPDGVDLVLNGIKSAENYQDEVFLMNDRREDFSEWKANIVGVDLNKQFPALWSLESERKPKLPTFRDFPGIKPLSEPESIAMAALTNRNNFHRVHAFHTQGEEIYWGFEGLEPEISIKIAKHYSRVSQYKSVRNVDNYAGYKDWFIKRFRRPGFTVELGKGVNPLPIEQFPKVYDATLNIFLANLALIV